ncbi:MAG: hypothetical protein IKD89_07630 [Clostridia bacterium]|nr:hypothetical protein [Clostridia bacterium]
MKHILPRICGLICLCLILSALCSCSLTSRGRVPAEVKLDGVTYKTGFYGDLWPEGFEETGDAVKVRGIEYHRVKSDEYDLIHSFAGKRSCGVIYCRSDQYDDAERFYNNPENFVYYCRIKNPDKWTDVKLRGFDAETFDALSAFCAENEYDPLDKKHNEKIETVELPMPDFDKTPELVFFCVSTDGRFESYQGYEILASGDRLYFLFYYDFGHGENEKMLAVPVPAEFEAYLFDVLKENGIEYAYE